MKQLIRTFILAGVVLLWCLTGNTRPASAGRTESKLAKTHNQPVNFKSYYLGRISLAPMLMYQNGPAVMSWRMVTNGIVVIEYDEEDGHYSSRVLFNWDKIFMHHEEYSPGDCTSVSMGWEDAYTTIKAKKSTQFDTNEQSFFIPIKIGRLKSLGAWQESYKGVPCILGEGDQKKVKRVSRLDGDDSWGASITEIKLYIIRKSGADSMGGVCDIPDWKDWNGNGYVSSLECSWNATNRINSLPAEWRKKK